MVLVFVWAAAVIATSNSIGDRFRTGRYMFSPSCLLDSYLLDLEINARTGGTCRSTEDQTVLQYYTLTSPEIKRRTISARL
jgi:hypothetical protein